MDGHSKEDSREPNLRPRRRDLQAGQPELPIRRLYRSIQFRMYQTAAMERWKRSHPLHPSRKIPQSPIVSQHHRTHLQHPDPLDYPPSPLQREQTRRYRMRMIENRQYRVRLLPSLTLRLSLSTRIADSHDYR